jgi:hypothetical protein
LDNELDAGTQAPPVIEFDPEGNVVNSWGDLSILPDVFFHGCTVDKDNNIYLVGVLDGILQKYSHDGKLLLQIGKKGVIDSSDGTNKGTALNSSHTQFFRPAGIAIDPKDGDIYVADGEGPNANHRVVVFDKGGKFLRQWDLRKKETDGPDWKPVLHCIAMDIDGNVYVCDRRGERFQIFDKMGNFKKYVPIPFDQRSQYPISKGFAPGTWGTSAYIAFSSDPKQKYIIDINEDDEEITFLDRSTLQIVSKFGRVGHQVGELTHAHFAPMDSRGNIYVGEVLTGERIDKFKPVP